MLSLPLKRSFRYVHEPLRDGMDAIPSLGNEQLAAELRDRIAYSRGGTFLISGFRGAGKSTTVLRALDALVRDGDRGELVVPVVLNIARSTDTDRLLFALVRRIFESLNDEGLLARLPTETQQSLVLAYMRTSLSFKQTVSDALERGAVADAGGGSALKTVVPKVSLTAKRTRSLAHEAQFLAYSETDVELPVPIDEDRRRLSAYYVIDWVLRSEGEPFRTADLFAADGNAGELDPLLRASPRSVEQLLRHLADHGVLETLRRAGDGDATLIGDVPAAQEAVYQLASGVKRALLDFARGSQSERAALGMPANPPTERSQIVIGRYRLQRVIGAGGMSRVWLGHDEVLGRPVAVKMLQALIGDESLSARFRREIKILAALDHPNIVRYFDAIERRDQMAIIMEFVNGPTLTDLVAEGPLQAEEVARIGAKLAHALVYLEHQNVFRLDMKPGNVMLPERDEPKIIDLGIARHPQAADITGAGSMIGTPHYMAPEQVDGKPLDHRGDIYAFGATMVFALTGAPPIEADNAMDVLQKLLTVDIDVSGLPCSREFRQVLHTCLRRDPNERFQHAADLLTALEAVPELVA
ncbi:serine/threonine-protein kinase [Actinomadura bangladeshensis]|uniref:non-specific serine/threonine protein kinase n=1 Tax=Actinomadura bangladeshensis TaxID=453573 RepID=A0A4R4NPR3_9ACTN|nr:serine/threonine-protein kinase [Actinomadura bangladeshensis]TDC09900.1 serine/threonine protein kinase [Actinomadura bangladeshensis]